MPGYLIDKFFRSCSSKLLSLLPISSNTWISGVELLILSKKTLVIAVKLNFYTNLKKASILTILIFFHSNTDTGCSIYVCLLWPSSLFCNFVPRGLNIFVRSIPGNHHFYCYWELKFYSLYVQLVLSLYYKVFVCWVCILKPKS